MYLEWTCSHSVSQEVKKAFSCLDHNELRVLSQLKNIPVKVYLPSTLVANSEMCPIKGPKRLKHRTVEQLEEDNDCN